MNFVKTGVDEIRILFAQMLRDQQFVTDKSGVKCLELCGASFVADQETIFGKVNEDYVKREHEWYDSMSLNVNDIPAPVPAIWKYVATPDGRINSNYGWAVYSEGNYDQYKNCFTQLSKDPDTRRAVMIYTRPAMQYDYNKDGMSDFMCTNNVQYMIRDNRLHAYVNMRSNDAIFGYKNDFAWQDTVLTRLHEDLNMIYPELEKGLIHWNVGSLHVYERHFDIVQRYIETGEHA